jgi:hypothetical protein
LHKNDFDAARVEAKAGIAEVEAEKLYRRAARLFKENELFDLKPLIEKLKTDYPKTRVVADKARKPSFAEMAESVSKLGKFLTVRKDGKGDFTSIQAAIDGAPPNSLIEIQDAGPYDEHVVIPKEGITLRGTKRLWPVIRPLGATKNFQSLVVIRGKAACLEGLVIEHGGPIHGSVCVKCDAPARLRRVVLVSHGIDSRTAAGRGPIEVAGSFLHGYLSHFAVARDSVVTVQAYCSADRCENVVCVGNIGAKLLRSCTVAGTATSKGPAARLDCVVRSINSATRETRVDYCNVFGPAPYVNFAEPGKKCFSVNPEFRDPRNFDYRLKPTSLCRKRASDGGDLGCRYTPEMLEVVHTALELRRKGIIKF